MRRLLASPRRRRRLVWVVLAGALVGLVIGANALLSSHGPSRQVRVAPRAPGFGSTTTTTSILGKPNPAEERARARAEATVRPLSDAFLGDLMRRRHLAAAYALLAPSVRSHYSLRDWQEGRDLPVAANTTATPGSNIAFSGAATVGLVASIAPPNSESESTLVAIRFQKTNGHWLIDYLHRGHSSARIDETNYSPNGFLPGSRHETLWTWLILAGGLLGIILVAVLLDVGLGRRAQRS